MVLFAALAVGVKFSIFYHLVQVNANRGLVVLLSCLITGLILLSFKNKWISVSLYLLISFMMFVDITYFSFFNRYLSLSMLGAAEVVGDIGDSIRQVMRPVNFAMFLDVILFYAFLIYKKVPLKSEEKGKLTLKSMRIPAVLLLIITLIVSNFPGSDLLTSLSNQEIYSFRVKDAVANTIGNGPESEIGIAFGYENHKDGPLFGVAENKNLVVIQLESLQNFVIGLEYNGQEVTPNLNKLIEGNSIYFDHYYQQTGSGNTSDAEFATNNSILGSLTSYTYKNYTQNYFRGLPVLLKEKGYSTASYHAHETRAFWNREEMYPNIGFDTFYGGIINDTQKRANGNYFMNEWMGWGLTDSKFYEQTIPYMKTMKEPYYSFIITLSNHHPYVMLDKYNFIELLPEDKDTLAGNYLNSAAYTDHALGEFLEALKAEGMYENTVFALYGDHSGLVNSEETDEVMGRILGKKYDFEEVMHVPLILHLPETEADVHQRVSIAGGQLDFLPTIAYLMGFDELDTVYMGQNLLTAKTGFVAEHTFMLKGSFFLDDIAFEMSRDGIFENARAWDVETGEPVSLDGLYEYYQKSLEVSDTAQFILDQDLIRKVFIEKQSLEALLNKE